MKTHHYYSPKYDPVFPNLSKWIDENCENQSNFARRLGVHRTTIYNIMRGIINPSWDLILAILKETGMTFEECFGYRKTGGEGGCPKGERQE